MNADMKELLLVNGVNGVALAVSFTEVESIFRIGLLAATIVYTVVKTVAALDNAKADKEDKDDSK